MPLAAKISSAFHAVTVSKSPPAVVDHLHTLIIDALACILGGAGTDISRIAEHSVKAASGPATILPGGPGASAAEATLVNGARLRSLDLMDVYVSVDVSHPSEAIPAALACAEAAGASGRIFLDSVLAALNLHTHLASTVALHRNALHHVGHAAWVVPLVAARLRGENVEGMANVLNLSAGGLLVPEGFSRGHVANLKGMAYALIAKRAIELSDLAAAGLRAQPGAVDETAALLGRIVQPPFDPEGLVPPTTTERILDITLKTYPAQYALQPLIAEGAAFRRRNPERVDRIARIEVKAAAQTVARTADPAKFRPASAEAADHSLPFCVAIGLLDGNLTPASLGRGRWRDADVLRLAAAMQVESVAGGEGFAIGEQEITLHFEDGSSERLSCSYPPADVTWRQTALQKLESFSEGRCDPTEIVDAVENLDHEPDVNRLVRALHCRETTPVSARL